MTASKAKQALNDGLKITHRFMEEYEWVREKTATTLVFEDGIEVDKQEFWDLRQSPEWEKDWSIFTQK